MTPLDGHSEHGPGILNERRAAVATQDCWQPHDGSGRWVLRDDIAPAWLLRRALDAVSAPIRADVVAEVVAYLLSTDDLGTYTTEGRHRAARDIERKFGGES